MAVPFGLAVISRVHRGLQLHHQPQYMSKHALRCALEGVGAGAGAGLIAGDGALLADVVVPEHMRTTRVSTSMERRFETTEPLLAPQFCELEG